jgi:hypothetical protein
VFEKWRKAKAALFAFRAEKPKGEAEQDKGPVGEAVIR